MNDVLKKLTGKNPKEFEPVAFNLINKPDVELFADLVEQDGFLFDFVKQNVSDRLAKCCNESNYLNLLSFLKYYSPSYEEFIVSVLADFADEDLTDKMLEIFEKGTEDEKTYCAKFFSYIQDPLALELLRKYAYSQNLSLASNCASTLGILKDEISYKEALEKLRCDDEFVKLDGVKFLTSYACKDAVVEIIRALKTSSMAENIAGEIPYLCDLFELYKLNPQDALFVLNSIINGLGEILGLEQLFDFQLYEFLQMLVGLDFNSKVAVVLANAKEKFDTLTENDEYLFDESKDVKNEVYEIKKLLAGVKIPSGLSDEELKEDSLFVYTALDLTNNTAKIRDLLSSSNPTVVLKSVEVLKRLNELLPQDKQCALKSVQNDNIKNIIMAM